MKKPVLLQNCAKNLNLWKKAIVITSCVMITATMPLLVNSQTLTTAKKAFILSKFCTEVKYNFARFDRLTFNWDSLCMAKLPTFTATKTDKEFTDSLRILCATIHDGHTFINTANEPGHSELWIRPLPMTTKRLQGRVFVDKIYSHKILNVGIDKNSEILEINGMSVTDYAQKFIAPYCPSSTSQWTDTRPFSMFELTKGISSEEISLVCRNTKGKTVNFRSNRLIEWDWDLENTDGITWKVLKGNIGHLQIHTFNDKSIMSEFDAIYPELLKTKALIIDVRNNGGGNSSYADYIMSHFIDTPTKQGVWFTPCYNAAFASWGMKQKPYCSTPAPMQPAKDKTHYTCPAVLLINASTFSSAENFTVAFRNASRGKLIGTPTGGSSGNPIFIDLGYGISCGICTREEMMADGTAFNGIGIIPDIEVEETITDMQKGKDTVLERAIKELK